MFIMVRYKVAFLFLLFSMISIFMVYGQLTERSAAGARFGSASGINYRYSLSTDRAFEGILSIQSNSVSSRFRLVGLYEYFRPFIGDFSWYYGVGGSVGNYKYKSFTDRSGNFHPSKSELSLSIDGVIGIDYSISTTPISLSLDLKPYFDFLQESTIRVFDPIGFSIRYRF